MKWKQVRPVSVLAQVGTSVELLAIMTWTCGILGKNFELGYELPKPIMFEVIAGVGVVVFSVAKLGVVMRCIVNEVAVGTPLLVFWNCMMSLACNQDVPFMI